MNQSSVLGVKLTGIVKRFGGVTALAGVDLTIQPGEVHALLGENGAGKSTLIRVLTGAVVPDSGDILVDGSMRRFSHPKDARLAGIAAVYQEPAIYPHLSVLENIFAGNEITSPIGVIKTASMMAQVKPWLAHLDLGEAILRRRMGELSLGYQQLVLITKALVQDARVIIFDEPTSILSRAETERLLKIIERFRADGRAIVYITHRLEEVSDMADRITVLTDGRMTGELVRGEFDEAQLLDLMAGKASRDYSRRRAPGTVADTKLVLEIENLSLKGRYDDVSWSAAAGQITGVYGLVGSGRSEVALTAFGALVPDEGKIRLDGKIVAPRTPAAAIALGIGYLPEDRKLQGVFATKSIESNMTVSKLENFSGAGTRLDFKGLRAEARRLVDRYRIKAPSEDVGIGTLSGGNQQKVLFARWAAQDLKVLILDEPTRGIDVGTKVEIHDFIRDLAADGLAVVVISSDLPEILSVSDRVIVMRRGRVVSVMEGGALTAEQILAAAVGAAFH